MYQTSAEKSETNEKMLQTTEKVKTQCKKITNM